MRNKSNKSEDNLKIYTSKCRNRRISILKTSLTCNIAETNYEKDLSTSITNTKASLLGKCKKAEDSRKKKNKKSDTNSSKETEFAEKKERKDKDNEKSNWTGMSNSTEKS